MRFPKQLDIHYSIMNIFILHLIPSICARYHVDKHVVKMILESTQLLCSAHHLHPNGYKPPYKLTHKNHPCAIWTRESVANYKWLTELAMKLCSEYTRRYKKIHKCQIYLEELSNNIPDIPDIGFTEPAQAMPDKYKNQSVVKAYRAYYNNDKRELFSWKTRDIPKWIEVDKVGLTLSKVMT